MKIQFTKDGVKVDTTIFHIIMTVLLIIVFCLIAFMCGIARAEVASWYGGGEKLSKYGVAGYVYGRIR